MIPTGWRHHFAVTMVRSWLKNLGGTLRRHGVIADELTGAAVPIEIDGIESMAMEEECDVHRPISTFASAIGQFTLELPI